MWTAGFIAFGFAYLELFPAYECQSKTSGEWYSCQPKEFCGKDVEVRVNWDDEDSLHNWVEQLDLVCDSQKTIGMVGVYYFAGWCSLMLIVPSLSDKIGRKWIVFWGLTVQAVAYTGIMLSTSLQMTFISIFVMGMMCSARQSVGFVFMNEFFAKEHQTFVGTWYCIGEAITYLSMSLFYRYVSKHTEYFIFIGLLYNICACIGVLQLPESPIFLLQKGEVDKGCKAIEKIA